MGGNCKSYRWEGAKRDKEQILLHASSRASKNKQLYHGSEEKVGPASKQGLQDHPRYLHI